MPDHITAMTPKGMTPVPVRKLLRGKIHRATVTEANLNYEGSITIDKDLMDGMDLLEWEAVHVWDVNNGERFETYALEGPRGSGVICVNGAAARKVAPGDLVIIGAFTWLDENAARAHKPKLVMVDRENRIKEIHSTNIASAA
jgi:aspartate 1-decarboxylase